MTLVLRKYQEEGVEKLRDAFKRGKRAPIYVLPTGGGKTAVFSYIAQSAGARGKRVSILVHRHELLMQASRSLSRLGVSHGVVSPKFSPTRHDVQVASVQTLVRRIEKTSPPDLIVIDEAHHATSSTYRKIIDAFPRAHILGVTATPCRGDGKGLDDIFDDIIMGPSIGDLIREGHLVEPVVYAPPVGIDLAGVHTRAGDFDKKELSERVDKPMITGDAVGHYLRLCPGEPAIAFCVSVKHAEHVAEEFRRAGIRSVRVDGGMEDAERKAAIDGLGNGTVQVLTSVDLIGEGLDIPTVSAAILLRPTQSLGLFLQQVGRALRPYPGKTRALILDHVGNVSQRHGFPDDPREWSLDGAPKVSKTQDGPAVRITQCGKCFFVYESGPENCPSCGVHAPPKLREIKVTEGELKQLTREAVARAKSERRVAQGSARTLDDLIRLGQSRGMANPTAWAKFVFNGRRRRA